MKKACMDNLNPSASNSHWNQFRKWFNSESLKLKELNYEIAQQNFCDHLKIFKDQVLRHWLKKPILLLDNTSWEASQESKCNKPSPKPQPLPLVVFKDKCKSVEESPEKESAAVTS